MAALYDIVSCPLAYFDRDGRRDGCDGGGLTVMSLLTECLPACLQSAECGRVVKALFRASGEWPFLGLLRPLLLFFFFFHSLKFLT